MFFRRKLILSSLICLTQLQLMLPGTGILNAQESEKDSVHLQAFSTFLSLAESRNQGKILEFYISNLRLIRKNSDLFKDMMMHLFSTGKFETAEALLQINPFSMFQHNELALYYYFLGISQMLNPRGWPNFKQAEKSIGLAGMELRRSFAPDYGFHSDIENALGYLAIVARGESTDSLMNRVTVIRHDMIRQGIHHFRDALVYNPENSIAQRNLDTLYAMLERSGQPIPADPYALNTMTASGISVDSVDIDSLNRVDSIASLNYSLLPKNYQLILQEMQAYDEIVLLIDLSGSMDDPVDWSYEASKFHIARELSVFIAINLRANVFLGAISVGRECDNTSMVLHHPIASVSRRELTMQIATARPHGHTPLNRRLRMTAQMFSMKTNRKLVFLLSDGMDTCGEIPDLCRTASMLAANGIDLSIFSFINETLEDEARNIFSVYNCMVHPSHGKIYTMNQDGDMAEEIDRNPVSNNILVLPPMDTSELWSHHKKLFQFYIEGVEPPISEIIRFE